MFVFLFPSSRFNVTVAPRTWLNTGCGLQYTCKRESMKRGGRTGKRETCQTGARTPWRYLEKPGMGKFLVFKPGKWEDPQKRGQRDDSVAMDMQPDGPLPTK